MEIQMANTTAIMDNQEEVITLAQPWKTWFKPQQQPAEEEQRQFVVNSRGCQNTKRSEYLVGTEVKKPDADKAKTT